MSASLSTTGGGASETFTFLSFTSENGYLLDQEMIEEETLETPGVDGRRFRTIFKQHTPTAATTCMAYASFGDAVIAANAYRKVKGRLATVTISAGGRVDRFTCHVRDVQPVPRAGAVAGVGASVGNAAHLLATWILEPTEFDPSESA